MNEFIVWDNVAKVFLTKDDFISDKITIGFLEGLIKSKEYEIYYDIRIKDINDKPIYAGCSIVEFELYNQTYRGIFTFDKSILSYILKVIDTTDISIENEFEFDYSSISECKIKIIDTIQENKLGLIKG